MFLKQELREKKSIQKTTILNGLFSKIEQIDKIFVHYKKNLKKKKKKNSTDS